MAAESRDHPWTDKYQHLEHFAAVQSDFPAESGDFLNHTAYDQLKIQICELTAEDIS